MVGGLVVHEGLGAAIERIVRDIRKFSHARYFCEDPVLEHLAQKCDTFAKNALTELLLKTLPPRGGQTIPPYPGGGYET